MASGAISAALNDHSSIKRILYEHLRYQRVSLILLFSHLNRHLGYFIALLSLSVYVSEKERYADKGDTKVVIRAWHIAHSVSVSYLTPPARTGDAFY